MPLALQAKLLRVLQEREIRRVGGRRSIPIDVRVVASTHRDLEAAMREGSFREDLYYRLAVFPIHVPPLRERQEDIPLLAEHFRKKHADRLGVSVAAIAPAATALLARYAWPGNVRELENLICRSLVLETSGLLQAATLPAELVPEGASACPPGASRGSPDATDARGRGAAGDSRRRRGVRPQPDPRRARSGHRPHDPAPETEKAWPRPTGSARLRAVSNVGPIASGS